MKKTLLCISIATLLSACGGSSGGSGSSETPTQTATPSQLNGEATTVSTTSITVAGYNLDAQSATVTYDDYQLTLNDIQPNMRVEVETNGDGQATEIELDPNLVGEISATTATSITVNGTILPTNEATNYSVGEWVFVNGYPNASGEWQVDNIFTIQSTYEAEIEGTVTNLNTSESTFNIGTTIVDYSQARLEDGTPANGDWVEVEGNFISSEFQATEVDIENNDRYDGDVEIEGTISWVNNAQTLIELNGRTQIIIDPATTRFEDGTQSDLTEGAQVDVELSNTNAGLVALEVEFEGGSGSNNGTTNSSKFALTGTATYISASEFTINGYSFIVDNRTEFDDRLTVNSIDGVDIEIEGVETSSGYLVYEVEAMDLDENEIDLEGDVSSGAMWGYSATDGSLDRYNGTHTEVECSLVAINSTVSNCRYDD